MFNRERNEIYKKKSIGYRGEALSSICKSSTLTITTWNLEEPQGLKVTFNTTGDIATLEPADMINCGTVVEVRDIFKNNKCYRKKFMSNITI